MMVSEGELEVGVKDLAVLINGEAIGHPGEVSADDTVGALLGQAILVFSREEFGMVAILPEQEVENELEFDVHPLDLLMLVEAFVEEILELRILFGSRWTEGNETFAKSANSRNGFDPELLQATRRVTDQVAHEMVDEATKRLAKKDFHAAGGMRPSCFLEES